MPAVCPHCEKEFKHEWILTRHLNRKTKCTHRFKCQKCNKYFKSKWELRRHKNIKTDCALRKTKIVNSNIDNSVNKTINNNNSINNSNIHLHFDGVNPFGRENKNYISKELIFDLIRYKAMPAMYFEMLHLHPDHPENHNIPMSNKREKMVKVKTKGGWKQVPWLEQKRDLINEIEYDMDRFHEYHKDDESYTPLLKEKMKMFLKIFSDFMNDDIQTEDLQIWLKKIEMEMINEKRMLLLTKNKDVELKTKSSKKTDSDSGLPIKSL